MTFGDVPMWFKAQVGRLGANWQKATIPAATHVEFFTLFGNRGEDGVTALVERILNDPAQRTFPTVVDIKRYLGHGSAHSDTRVDLTQAFVWGVDGSFQGSPGAIPELRRADIAKYIASQLVPVITVHGEYLGANHAIRDQQLELIRILHDPTYREALAAIKAKEQEAA